MGTNYYANIEIDGKLVHLGKLSMGWEFCFFSAFGCTSWRELRAFLQHNNIGIMSEECDLLSLEEFSNLVHQSKLKKAHVKNEPKNHFFWVIETKFTTNNDWIDIDGWSFCDTEFS
jgi:hypothetical protein